MTNDTELRIDMERTLDAAVERVFAVLTGAEHIAQWFGPSDDYKIKVHEWDCRVGGKYRVAFHTSPDEVHTVVGEFREITPNQRVSYTWSWEGQPPMDTLVTFDVEADGKQTHLKLTHEGLPLEELRQHHSQGWSGSLERLTRAIQ